MTDGQTYDVVVVGSGNAGLCAALSAREHVERVAVIEKAPVDKRGGNSWFSGGRMRIAHNGLEDVADILGVDPSEMSNFEIDPYPVTAFVEDVQRVSRNQADENFINLIAKESRTAIDWLKTKGARFELALGEDDIKVGEVVRLVGGDDIQHFEGGPGLIDNLVSQAEKQGIDIYYECAAKRIVKGDDGVEGILAQQGGKDVMFNAGAVVLACGGFEANAQMRAAYLGPGWDLAKVRGTEFNTGDGITMGVEVGARPHGHYSGCHSVACDYFAPSFGDRIWGDVAERVSFRAGITVDRHGKRYFDEGSDLRAYTYAVSGRNIVEQADGFAVQIIDAKGEAFLRRNYFAHNVTKAVADDLETIANELGIDPAGLVRTVEEFNAAVQPGEADFSKRDGKRTEGIDPPKSNWAMPIDTPPYTAYPVAPGITFTFGGLLTSMQGHVLDEGGTPITGLFAAGELVGGIYYHNYPGGSGLVSGLVMGRRAGESAATFAKGA